MAIYALVRRAIIFSNSGRLWATSRQRRRSAVVRSDLQRDVSTTLTNEKCTLSPGNTGRYVQYYDQIVDDCPWLRVFKGKNLYHAVILSHQWRRFDIILSLGIAGNGQCGVAENRQALLRKIARLTRPLVLKPKCCAYFQGRNVFFCR